MMQKYYDAVVIGAGCAGLAAAVALKKNGIKDVVVLEKDEEIGGILNQCIHNGFGSDFLPYTDEWTGFCTEIL